MNLGQAIGHNFRNYATFSGRAQRSQYWWWVLATWVGSLVITVIDSIAFGTVTRGAGSFSAQTDFAPLTIIFSLGIILPTLAVAVRRLHDIDSSGWWLLIGLIPLVGTILLIVWFATKGTMGDNRFGADPLDDEAGAAPPLPG